MNKVLLRSLGLVINDTPYPKTERPVILKSTSLASVLNHEHTKNKVIIRALSYGLRTDLLDMTVIATSS